MGEIWLPLLRRIADAADPIALELFGSPRLVVETKPDRSPVTAADQRIEETARAIARRDHPGIGILGEEFGEEGAQESIRLIIDPIDATDNFVRGIPVFATLLAIEERDEVVAGLVSAPALSNRWEAERGLGAYSCGRRLAVSKVSDLSESHGFHAGLGDERDRFLPPRLRTLLERPKRTRGFGDFYQHVLVAGGCGEFALDPRVEPWDVGPLLVILEEAGGRATTFDGRRSIRGGSLVTSNGRLHEEVLGLLDQSTG